MISPYVFAGLSKRKNVAPEFVIDAAIEVMGVDYDELMSKCKKRPLAYCRHFISLILYTDMIDELCAEEKIGELLGRDRTTILHSVEQARNLIETDERCRSYYERIKKLANEREKEHRRQASI